VSAREETPAILIAIPTVNPRKQTQENFETFIIDVELRFCYDTRNKKERKYVSQTAKGHMELIGR
jgi:hypothetical protein